MKLRRLTAVAVAAVLAIGVVGCTAADPNATAYQQAAGAGNVSADGQIAEFPEGQRGDPVTFTGVTDTGAALSSADLLGKIVVVNFWYAGCGPCRIEAPYLEDAYQSNKDQDVVFLGVNTVDAADTALAFAEAYGVTYPSLIDEGDGAAKIAFAKVTPLQTTPTTLVLDREGRVAAHIIGAIDGPSVLNTLVRELADAS